MSISHTDTPGFPSYVPEYFVLIVETTKLRLSIRQREKVTTFYLKNSISTVRVFLIQVRFRFRTISVSLGENLSL